MPGNDERPWCRGVQLPAQAEFVYEIPVPSDVFAVQVVQEAATATDELKQASAAGVVVAMLPKVFGQLTDSFGEDSYLYFS